METPVYSSRFFSHNYRWLVVALIFMVTVVSYLDRSALAYAVIDIEKQFGLNDEAFGWIFGGFGIGYVIMAIVGGILCDRFGTRRIWAIAVFFWSVVTVLMVLGRGFWSFFALRIALGLCEGVQFPAIARTIANWLPLKERGLALAISILGVPFASVIGAPLCSWLIVVYDWRVMFGALGILGFVWVSLWYYFFRDFPIKSHRVNRFELNHILEGQPTKIPKVPVRKAWKKLLSNRTLLANYWSFFVLGYLIFFGITWMPDYFERTYQTKISTTGLFLILPWALACVSMVYGGYLCDSIYRKTQSLYRSRSQVIWISQLLSAICFALLVFFQNETFAIVMTSFGIAFGLLPNAQFFAINIDVSKESCGFSSGIMDAFFALAGIVSPVITGALAQIFDNFTGGIALLALLSLTSVLGIIIFERPDRDQIKSFD